MPNYGPESNISKTEFIEWHKYFFHFVFFLKINFEMFLLNWFISWTILFILLSLSLSLSHLHPHSHFSYFLSKEKQLDKRNKKKENNNCILTPSGSVHETSHSRVVWRSIKDKEKSSKFKPMHTPMVNFPSQFSSTTVWIAQLTSVWNENTEE